jgi:hypothetical protein
VLGYPLAGRSGSASLFIAAAEANDYPITFDSRGWFQGMPVPRHGLDGTLERWRTC